MHLVVKIVLNRGFLGPFELLDLAGTNVEIRNVVNEEYNLEDLVTIRKGLCEEEEWWEDPKWAHVYGVAASKNCLFTLVRQFHLHEKAVLEDCLSRSSSVEVATFSLQKGVDIDCKVDMFTDTSCNPSCLEFFIQMHETELAKFLIRKGAVATPTTAFYAIAAGNLAILKLLIENGVEVSPEMKDRWNKSPIFCLATQCAGESFRPMLDFMLSIGCSVSESDSDGNTLADMAVASFKDYNAQILAEHGSAMNVTPGMRQMAFRILRSSFEES